jgi:UDP-glucose 4-epimerase
LPRNHRVLVTGASGTLGYNVVHLLARDTGTQLVLPLRTLEPPLFRDYANVHVRKANLSDRSDLRRILADVEPTAIVHCAASGVRPGRSESWFDMLAFNVGATLQVFEEACAVPNCHFIYVSTGLVYRAQARPLREDDPVETLHPYGVSKSAADSLLQATAAEFKRILTVVRPFAFTGLHDGGNRLFPSLLRAAAAGTPFPLSPGEQIRDFCAVQDIASAVKAILNYERRRQIEVFNVGSGSSATLRQIVERVCRDLDLHVDLRFGEAPYHPHESMHLVADIRKARTLGWEPVTNLSYAVWELARVHCPALPVRRPEPAR